MFNSLDGVVSSTFSTSTTDLVGSLEEHANIAEWINGLLDTQNNVDVTELTTRLEVACQDTTSQLEQSIDDISRTVPRLTYDLHFLRESALALKVALSSLQTRLSTSLADEATHQALDRLAYLDMVKRRMELSRDVLREAESWSTLEQEVTALLAELQYSRAAERLADARRSMPVFQNTPAYEPRKALMTSLQNQLEAALSAALVAAINSRDVEACKTYYGVFANIQRESEFRNYYYGSRRSALVQMWAKTVLSDVEGETPSDDKAIVKFADLLQRFFTDFIALLNEERSYTPAIFPDAQQTLSTFIQSTIDSLNPSLSQRLSGLVEHYGALALPELIISFRAAEQFAIAADKILEKVGYTALFSPTIEDSGFGGGLPPKTPTHSRRLSKRMSMSRRLNSSRSTPSVSGKIMTVGFWEQVLFEPFLDLQAEYESLEHKMLEKCLADVKAASQDTGGDDDMTRTFRGQSVDIFGLAEEALARCMEFTHGYGVVGMLKATDRLISAFLDGVRAEFTSASYSSSLSQSQLPDDALLSDLDYTPSDWYTIQLALHMLDACRLVHERFGLLTQKIRSGLVQVASAFTLGRQDSQGLYISGTTRGEVQLLNQSTLNSAELNSLLENVGSSSSALSITSPSPSASPRSQAASTVTDFLPLSRSSLNTLTRSAQSSLSSTLLSPLMRNLRTYGSLTTWTSSQASLPGLGNDPSIVIPTFSLSPSPTIQRLAEGLLNLPRLFELYGEDDALTFGVELLPFARTTQSEETLTPERDKEVDGEQSFAPETIISMWLISLTLTLLNHLTGSVLPVIREGGPARRGMSKQGESQLESDMEYLVNVVGVLGVEWTWKEPDKEGNQAG